MNTGAAGTRGRWIHAGDEMFPAMLGAIDAAGETVCLETYIFGPGGVGSRFLDALTRAAGRGVQVRVLVDALGSMNLPAGFWAPLQGAGGEVRFFNPLAFRRMGIRDHRKLLACDGQVAFIGGFNIADEYEGDGVTRGWRDVGVRVEGTVVQDLCESFEDMFARAEFRHKRFIRLRRSTARRAAGGPDQRLLLSGPGWGANPIRKALLRDLAAASDVRIVMAYFLPSWRLRQSLVRIVRRGGRVQLVLPGKSDVRLSQLAARSLYRRLLRAGVEIYEYQPQVLHAKLILCDQVVYAGSANLDPRGLAINYELMIRFVSEADTREAAGVFDQVLRHARAIKPEEWLRGRSFWSRVQQRWAYMVLVRLDPYIARRQWRGMPD